MDPFRYSSPTSSQRIAASPGVALGLHGSLIDHDIEAAGGEVLLTGYSKRCRLRGADAT